MEAIANEKVKLIDNLVYDNLRNLELYKSDIKNFMNG
jgi:hypothetical protein